MQVHTAKWFYNNVKRQYNNDGVDRLNHLITPIILVAFTLIHWTKLFVSSPINCMSHASDKPQWFKYINMHCLYKEKYFISPNSVKFPTITDIRYSQPVDYYQWVAIVFLGQALFAAAPHWFWEGFAWKSGIVFRPITAAITRNDKRSKKILGRKVEHKKVEHKHNEESEAAKFFIDALKFNAERVKNHEKTFCVISPRAYVSTAYLFYKALNSISVFCHLFFLNQFLNTNYHLWGIGVFMDLLNGIKWETSGNFPRIAYCDFMRREDSTGAVFQSTSQCLLPFNLGNEVMFIFIWFWFALLCFVNLISFLRLLYFLTNRMQRHKFIEDLLSYEKINQSNTLFKHFVDHVLGKDGATFLRILTSNATRLAVSDFTHQLWEAETKKPSDPFNDTCFIKKDKPFIIDINDLEKIERKVSV